MLTKLTNYQASNPAKPCLSSNTIFGIIVLHDLITGSFKLLQFVLCR